MLSFEMQGCWCYQRLGMYFQGVTGVHVAYCNGIAPGIAQEFPALRVGENNTKEVLISSGVFSAYRGGLR